MMAVVVRNYLLLHPLSLCPQAFAAPTVLPHHHHLRLLRCSQPHLSLLQSHTLLCMHVQVNMHAMTYMHIHCTHAHTEQVHYLRSQVFPWVQVGSVCAYTLEVNILKGIYSIPCSIMTSHSSKTLNTLELLQVLEVKFYQILFLYVNRL